MEGHPTGAARGPTLLTTTGYYIVKNFSPTALAMECQASRGAQFTCQASTVCSLWRMAKEMVVPPTGRTSDFGQLHACVSGEALLTSCVKIFSLIFH
jgi:hypothetical protein